MRCLYETSDRTRAQLLRSALEAEGVQAHVQGEHLTSLQGETPAGSSAQYRVLLRDDDQWPKAELFMAAWTAAQSSTRSEPWMCTSCGEHHEPQFGSCWKCGADSDAT